MTVEARQAKLELSTETVNIHKNGIEFAQRLSANGPR